MFSFISQPSLYNFRYNGRYNKLSVVEIHPFLEIRNIINKFTKFVYFSIKIVESEKKEKNWVTSNVTLKNTLLLPLGKVIYRV